MNFMKFVGVYMLFAVLNQVVKKGTMGSKFKEIRLEVSSSLSSTIYLFYPSHLDQIRCVYVKTFTVGISIQITVECMDPCMIKRVI